MRIKTNAVPELELTRDNGLLVKRSGDKAYRIADDTFKLLTTAYKNVKAENGDKAVMTLGKGESASTFLFAYDEDSKQNVLFMDGYLVVKILPEGNKINVYVTDSNTAYKSFDVEDLVAKKMTEVDNAVDAEKEVKTANQEVVNYFKAKMIEEPILKHAQNEVDTRKTRIDELEDEIKNLESNKAEDYDGSRDVNLDNDTTQNTPEVVANSNRLNAFKKEIKAKKKEVETLNNQLYKAQDDKLAKKLDIDIQEYEKAINALEKTKKENDSKMISAEKNLDKVQNIAEERLAGKKVALDRDLKPAKEYRKEIAKLAEENSKIENKIEQLKKKKTRVENQKDKNLGYEEQLAKIKEQHDNNVPEVTSMSNFAQSIIAKIENNFKYPEPKENVTIEDVARIENDKYQAAVDLLKNAIDDAAKEVEKKEDALRSNNVGNLYVRAKEITGDPKDKYNRNKILYKYINGFKPIYYGQNITLKGKPGYGCLVVGPKLNVLDVVSGFNKKQLNRTMYIIVGKTVEEVEKTIPAKAEDFLNIEGAKVYAVRDIHSKGDYTKAYAKGYKDTKLTDAEGNKIFDANENAQFPSSKMINIGFEIKTNKQIVEYDDKQAEKAKKNGEKVEERVVEFTTPEMLEQISNDLGAKDALDIEKSSYWKYDYTKSVVKKPIIVAAVVAGAALLAAGATLYVVSRENTISAMGEELTPFDTDAAFEDGKKQVGDKFIDYTYDKDKNVIMTKTNSVLLTNDITPYNDQANAKGWTDCGALYQYVYNTTVNLGKDGNLLIGADGKDLYDEYFKDLQLQTYEQGKWDLIGAPKDANGNIITDLQITSAKQGFEDGARDYAKVDPSIIGTSAVDPQNEELNDEAQKRINKDTKDTNKTMVVNGVYVDFAKDTAFAVSENGKNIVKLSYKKDIKNIDDVISGMTETTTDWFTCAAANPYLPGVKYQNYYVSDSTNIKGDVYSKNFIEVEKEDANYTFAEFKGYDVLNEETKKIPSMNMIAYVSLVGTAAHNVDGYTVYDKKGDETVYTATTPESTTAATAGQIFNYEKTK